MRTRHDRPRVVRRREPRRHVRPLQLRLRRRLSQSANPHQPHPRTHQPPAERRMTTMVDAALAYPARPSPVFPSPPGPKAPATTHGFKDATTDPETIRSWWTDNPAYNVAIATGEQSIDVLDIDIEADSNGYTALAELTRLGLLKGHGQMV